MKVKGSSHPPADQLHQLVPLHSQSAVDSLLEFQKLNDSLYLSMEVRQLRGGREERQLSERLREEREARASPGQKVDRSRKVTPCPVT